MNKLYLLIFVSAISLMALNFTGCAPVIPKEIRKDLDLGLTLEDVSGRAESFKGAKVLWGGVIVSSKNEAEKTAIEVVEAPLDSSDRPGNIDKSKGRFIVEYNGFLDTAVYTSGREITVAGEITGAREGKIGDMNYTFPLLKTLKIHLWEKEKEVVYDYPPFFCDPFCYPYYHPYYPYGYPRYRR